MAKNYDYFLKADLSPFIGEWIAICGNKIIAHGPNVKEVFAAAKEKYPNKRPLLVRVPEKETMIF